VLSLLFPSLARPAFIILPFLFSKYITKQRIELNCLHHHYHYRNGYYPLVFVSVSHVVKLVSVSSLLYLKHWLWILKFPSTSLVCTKGSLPLVCGLCVTIWPLTFMPHMLRGCCAGQQAVWPAGELAGYECYIAPLGLRVHNF
jgi:hypothetical protein